MKIFNSIVLGILIIGAINWGSIGLFGVDLVATLFGGTASIISRIVYILVGICGIYAFTFFNKVDNENEVRDHRKIERA